VGKHLERDAASPNPRCIAWFVESGGLLFCVALKAISLAPAGDLKDGRANRRSQGGENMHLQTNDREKGSVNFGFAGKVVVLFGLTLSSYGFFGPSPVLPSIEAAYSSDPNAGLLSRLIVSALGVVVAITSPVVGAVADRVGARRVLVAALLLYALAGCAPFFLDNLYAIVATRIVFGLSVAAFGAVVMTMLVANSSGAMRNRWLGYMTTVGTVTGIFLYPLVGHIGEISWRLPFLTYAIGIPFLLLSIIGFPRDAPHVPATQTKTAPSRSLRCSLGTPFGYVVFALLVGAALMSPSMFAPFRIREIGITDSSVMGNLMIPFAAASVVSAFSYGWLRSRLSIEMTFVLGFTAMAIGTAALAASDTVGGFIVGQVLAGLGLGVNSPNLFAVGATVGDDAYRARTIGFTKSGIYGGPIIGQLILEPVLKQTSFSFAFAVISFGCVAFIVANIWQLVRRRGEAGASSEAC
jgi:MFS family permease